MNERQIRGVIGSVLTKLAGGALALGTLVGCSGPSQRPDPNLPPGPDAAQVADARAATPDARPAPPPEEDPKDWRLRRRQRRSDPNAPPMPYMAPDAAPLHETLG